MLTEHWFLDDLFLPYTSVVAKQQGAKVKYVISFEKQNQDGEKHRSNCLRKITFPFQESFEVCEERSFSRGSDVEANTLSRINRPGPEDLAVVCT